MTPASMFDRMAADYDERWTNTAIGGAQRRLVWRHVDALFRPGEFLLDVGCGTGEDAAHFAARGIRVHGIEASAEMVRACSARTLACRVETLLDARSLRKTSSVEKSLDAARKSACATVTAEVRSAEDLASLGGNFDAVLSNFGALNCVGDLAGVAVSLAGLTRPGAVAAICLLGRLCAWEVLYYSVRLQFRKAFRRWSGNARYHDLMVYYPNVSEVQRAFADGFELRSWTGIGLCVPPSYVPLPAALVRGCEACDQLLARLPLLRALADHRLFILVRK